MSTTILIIEDERPTWELIEAALASSGYRLVFTPNGPEGLSQARNLVPDVILLDIMMPGMTGFEVCEELRGDPVLREVPIIFMTAMDDRQSRLLGLRAGADEFLTKPLDIHELRARLEVLSRLNRFRRLLSEQQKFHSVVQFAPHGILIINDTLQIRFANEAANRLLAASEALPLIDTPFPMFMAENHAGLEERLREVALGTPPTDPERMELMRLDGEKFPAMLTAGPIEWENNQATQVILQDLTHHRRLEHHLLRAQRLNGLGSMAGGIAHDLNNIMAPIVVAAETLLDPASDEHRQQHAGRILRAARHGSELVQQILSFASGAGSRTACLPFKYIIDEVRSLLSKSLPADIDITTSETAESVTMTGDPTQLTQLLMNLCLNARDAMPEGGAIKIDARIDPGTDRLHLTIADQGKGIPKELIDEVWNPFFTTKPHGKGTGLGLSTARTIVENHQGTIEVESSSGEGTRVHIHLPGGGAPPRPLSLATEPEVPDANGESILFCDEDAAIRELAAEVLECYGYRVITAANGAECIFRFEQEIGSIAGLLCDASVPHLDGAQVIKTARRQRPGLPCVLISGNSALLADASEKIPNLRILQKPFSRTTLLECLHAVRHDSYPPSSTNQITQSGRHAIRLSA